MSTELEDYRGGAYASTNHNIWTLKSQGHGSMNTVVLTCAIETPFTIKLIMNKSNNVSQLFNLRPYKQVISTNATAQCALFTITTWWHTTCEAP